MTNKNKIIFLTGFMGAGKSTVGPILANTLGWNFYDLDRVIEEHENRKIKEIFAADGEDYFRKIESEFLIKVAGVPKTVISLGGGTVIFNDNLKFIKENGILVYLKTTPEAVAKRLLYKRDRPNLTVEDNDEKTKKEFLEKITNLYEDRKNFYEQADIIVPTEKAQVGVTVDKIASIISKKYNIYD